MAQTPRLRQRYETEIRPALMERFEFTNTMEAPIIQKVAVNMRVGDAATASSSEAATSMEGAVRELGVIIGQKPAITRARKSIANFGIREGMPLACRATLRGPRAWEFVDRLFNIALPRIRDFRGLPRSSFDGRGNYSITITDQLVFPELGYDDVTVQRGLNITIVTTARTDEQGVALLEGLGLPLQRIETEA